MEATLFYFLKVNVALVLFYAFYRLLFTRDTFFGIRRALLNLFWILAFAYPFLDNITWMVSEPYPVLEAAVQNYVAWLPEVIVQSEGNRELFAWPLWMMLYGGVTGLLFLRFAIQLGGILHLAFTSTPSEINGVRVRLLSTPSGPFSFFGWIFIHPEAHSEKELAEILIHEATHAREGHSWDILLSELITCLCWANPFVWLLKREVRYNLEYLADASVLRAGCDGKTYQYHLLGLAYHKAAATLYTHFNVVPLKNRIRMMNKQPSQRIGIAKLFLLFPLLACLLLLSNCKPSNKQAADADGRISVSAFVTDDQGPVVGANVIIKGTAEGTLTDLDGRFTLSAPENGTLLIAFPDYKPKEIAVGDIQQEMKIKLDPEQTPAVSVTPDGKTSIEEEVFTVVEEQPEFPGGTKALLNYLSKNIKYPTIAQENGIQGRVVLSFIVRKDGSVSDIEIVRGVDPVLDQEAVRVVEAMPKWKPGKQKGVVVNVKYVLPVMFRLQ